MGPCPYKLENLKYWGKSLILGKKETPFCGRRREKEGDTKQNLVNFYMILDHYQITNKSIYLVDEN